MDLTKLSDAELNQMIASQSPKSTVSSMSDEDLQHAISTHPDRPPDSMATQGAGYLAQHPFKSILQGLPQTITGKTLKDTVVDNSPKTPFTPDQAEAYKSQWGQYPEKYNELSTADRLKAVGGAAVDTLSSPSNIALPFIGKAVGALGETAGKTADWLEGRQFNTLSKGENAVDALHAVKAAKGQDVSAKFMNPLGDVLGKKNDFQNLMDRMPQPLQDKLAESVGPGKDVFDLASDGSIIPNVRNAHQMRLMIDNTVKSKYFQNLQNAPEAQAKAVKISNELGEFINKTTPQIRAVNGPYHDFSSIADPIINKMTDPTTAETRLNAIRQIAKGIGNGAEDKDVRNLYELRKQVPEVNDLVKQIKADARWKAVRGMAGAGLRQVGNLVGLKAAFPEAKAITEEAH